MLSVFVECHGFATEIFDQPSTKGHCDANAATLGILKRCCCHSWKPQSGFGLAQFLAGSEVDSLRPLHGIVMYCVEQRS